MLVIIWRILCSFDRAPRYTDVVTENSCWNTQWCGLRSRKKWSWSVTNCAPLPTLEKSEKRGKHASSCSCKTFRKSFAHRTLKLSPTPASRWIWRLRDTEHRTSTTIAVFTMRRCGTTLRQLLERASKTLHSTSRLPMRKNRPNASFVHLTQV